jgi:hypothetical protein
VWNTQFDSKIADEGLSHGCGVIEGVWEQRRPVKGFSS